MASQRRAMTCVSAFLLLVALSGLAVEGQSMDSSPIDCRSLPASSCSYAVNSDGARCVLETSIGEKGRKVYQCQTSEISSSKGEQYIESDGCVNSCGLDRKTVGISTDEFFLPGFAEMLCSFECQNECTNIVDLFSSIVAAAAEGASLDRFCNDFHASQGLRRVMRGTSELKVSKFSELHGISPSSSVDAEAPGPATSAKPFPSLYSPAPAPHAIPAPPPYSPAPAPGISAGVAEAPGPVTSAVTSVPPPLSSGGSFLFP